MGNANKKKKKQTGKITNSDINPNSNPNTNLNTNLNTNNKKTETNQQPDIVLTVGKNESSKITLELINQYYHSSYSDAIIEAFIYPNFEDSVVIACKSGNIKVVNDILSSKTQNNFSNIKDLYGSTNKIYSCILLKQNKNRLCLGLEDNITILELNNKQTLKVMTSIACKAEGPIFTLLELENGNIVSAGRNIILWEKKSNDNYIKASNVIPLDYSRVINLVEFPLFNTIIATQENTHKIFLLKNEGNSINLVKQNENIPSIWYKGSAQYSSKNCMLLVGKFELNAIDAFNGEVCSRYPGMDRGTLLNLTQKYKENDFWIVSDFMGNYLEFYEQDGNDFIYLDKWVFGDNEKIGWGNRLIRINDEVFIAINRYGKISVFKIKKL